MAVTRHSGGRCSIDYTPASAKTAGDVVVLATGLIGIVESDIAADALGSLAIDVGPWKAPKASGALVAGQIVFWDAGNARVTGTQGTGGGGTAQLPRFGTVILAAGSSDTHCYVAKDPMTPAVRYGEIALDGSNPTPVTTGLTAILGVSLSLKTASAPGVGTQKLTYDTSGGTLNIYGWKPTGSGDCTLIASTGTETVGWTAYGY